MSNRTSSETMDSNTFTVKMTNVSFSYRRDQMLLNNINMSFPRSSIYGLLGPSGCGKTTLLKLILGLKRPNGGTIRVNGRKPLDAMNQIPGSGVGFQPQEIALYEEFTIRETLNYFAQIYGMKSDSKQKRIEFLIEFLGLPNPDTRISKLRSELFEHTVGHNLVIHFSGGQQRRVSLAVTIVHNPPFLILDEPTVGVDPLLREKIWNHLVELSNKEKTSILITTHYVEEARRAHVVALMRSGTIPVEHSPQYLMQYFDAKNLEEVFLKVSLAQDQKNQQMPKSFIKTTDQSQLKSQDKAPQPVHHINLSPNFCQRFLALANKNRIRIGRNLLMVSFQVLTPTFSMILFLLCVGQSPSGLNIGVFNGESLPASDPLAHNCVYNNLSQYYIDSIDRSSINLINYDSYSAADESVREGETYGSLVFDPDFSVNLCDRLTGGESVRNKSKILYHGDLTDVTIFSTILKKLNEAQMKFVYQLVPLIQKERQNDTELNGVSMEPTFEISQYIYGTKDTTFREFMTPGMMIAGIFILAVGLTAISFVQEKRGSLLDRTLMAGVRIHEILMAQIFVQVFVLLVQIAVLLLILFGVFGIDNKGSIPLIILINLLQGVLGMTYGLVISIIAHDEQSALMIAFGSFFPFLLMSGVFWPIEGMVYGLQLISYYMPQTLAVLSLRNVMMKGWSLTYTYVWLGFVSTMIWLIILVVASICLSSL